MTAHTKSPCKKRALQDEEVTVENVVAQMERSSPKQKISPQRRIHEDETTTSLADAAPRMRHVTRDLQNAAAREDCDDALVAASVSQLHGCGFSVPDKNV